jgi:hypothetical protein
MRTYQDEEIPRQSQYKNLQNGFFRQLAVSVDRAID